MGQIRITPEELRSAAEFLGQKPMWVAEEGSYYYPCGKIIGITNQTAWSIHDSSGKGYMSYKYKEKYPVGSIIDVEYAEYKHMGCKKFIDIRYIDKE